MPVPLRAISISDETTGYVLLNGSRGSLYLRRTLDDDFSTSSRITAWSTNVGHAVSIKGDEVLLQRWDRDSIERFEVSRVAEHMEQFHRQLERESPPADMSVVAHGIRVFRSLRQGLGEDFSSTDSLLVYLLLLATTTTGSGLRADVDLSKWALPERAREVAEALSADTWTTIAETLVRGRKIENLRPDVRLMLRHASGALFQEAHHIAVFEPPGQMYLIPTPPTPVTVARKPSSSAAHYTPAAITRSIVERALLAIGELPDVLRVLDPACGSGEFLRETLRQLRLRGYRGHLSLVGFDVSEAACVMARFSLAAEINTEEGESPMTVSKDIRCLDALSPDTSWGESQLILTNPPFVSWTDMPPDARELVKTVLGKLANRRPDLASAFLLKAARSLADGGVLGSVVPASIFDGTSAAEVRAELGTLLAPDLIARLGSHQLFYGARVDAGIYVGRRAAAVTKPPLALWADHKETSTSAALRTLRRLGASEHDPVLLAGFNIYPNSSIGRDSRSWAPRPYAAWKITEAAASLPVVGDFFVVRQGILTGLNRVFILDDAALARLPARERFAFRKAVVNESIRGGRVVSTVWVFYPYGAALIESEAELTKRLPTYYANVIVPARAELISRARRTDDNWWKLTESRPKWQVEPGQKIASTYFGDSGSFAWDEDGDLAVVQGYAWLPKAQRREKSIEIGRRGWLALLAILSSRYFSVLLSAHSNHVGGGQWNLSQRFVEKIPLPNLFREPVVVDSGLLLELASFGEKIHASGLEGVNVEDLDESVRAAYAPVGSLTNGQK
jgi:adenine-specific DNA-methyltransferase